MSVSPELKTYIQNKLSSLSVIGLIILGSFMLLGYTVLQWQFILIAIIVFGYGHFLVGFFYQLKSFTRKENPECYYLVFLVLTLLSVGIAQILFEYAGHSIALFVGFVYFLLHGLFNEQTLIKRQAKINVPLVYILSLAVFVMSLLTYTIPDPTFFFDRALAFMHVDQFILVQIFKYVGLPISYFSLIFWFGVGLSFVTLAYAWIRYRLHRLSLFFAVTFGGVTLLTALFGALPYIYMYLIVVGYHFMTWFLFYVKEMKSRGGEELRKFYILHLIFLSPFLVAGCLFFLKQGTELTSWLLDYKYYVIATYIHISTSFMNDEWFIKLQNKFFN